MAAALCQPTALSLINPLGTSLTQPSPSPDSGITIISLTLTSCANRKYILGWVGFQNKALQWRIRAEEMADVPFELVKRSQVTCLRRADTDGHRGITQIFQIMFQVF